MKSIGSSMFSNHNLREIAIPASVEQIGDMCFFCCWGLLKVTFQSGSVLKGIGTEAFARCKALRQIEIPTSVTELGHKCFFDSGLTKITFCEGSNLKVLPHSAFTECAELEVVEVPASVEEIDDRCFYNSSLAKITFASGGNLKRIGKEAFIACKNLKEIEIPASVELIDEKCFEAAEEDGEIICALSRITFESGSKLKGLSKQVFRGCINLKEIEIPATTASIGDFCFYGCSSLASVTFAAESSMKRIGSQAFYGCVALEKIELQQVLRKSTTTASTHAAIYHLLLSRAGAA